MSRLLIVTLIACGALSAWADGELSVDPANLIEHSQVVEAQAFGWGALPGATLQTEAPAKIGRYGLRAEPSPEPQEYMGIGLRHDIDLTGVGPDGKIIFFVKQNFGSDLFINMHTDHGNAHRSVKVKQGQWTRVEVDLNLAHWDQSPERSLDAWTKVNYLHIYSKGFNAADEYMLLDGFAVLAGGKPVLTRPATDTR